MSSITNDVNYMNKPLVPRIYFVVLHYQAIKETIACVESLKKLEINSIYSHIIVVDNASPNESGKQLKELYKKDNQVQVVISKDNVGFAKGNNIGFAIAKNEGADFIILINNDTVIKDIEFLKKIDEIYQRTSFAVLGPDVLSVKDQVHQNPMSAFELSSKTLRKKILKAKCILLMNKIGFTKFLVSKKNNNNIFMNNYKEECSIEKKSNMVLHGSCLIFSPKYIDKFDGLHEGTFMYYEENILAYRCYENDLKMIYSPIVQIEHYRNVSTDMVYNKNDRKKIDFFYKQSIKSLSVLLGMVNNEK